MKQLHSRAVWLFFFQNLFWFAFICLIFSFWGLPALFATTNGYSVNFAGVKIIGFLLIVIIPILSYIWARLSYYFYRYGLFPEGVKIEKGVIWKRYVTIPYGRIQNVDIHRGPLARILGLSDLQIQTAGYSYGKGIFAEGRLPGLSPQDAESLRDELVKKVEPKPQGL